MPTVLRVKAYRFYFYSHEPNEPSHIHVDRDNLSAKFWLKPVALASNIGFSAKELRKIHSIIEKHQETLVEDWNGYFDISPVKVVNLRTKNRYFT